MSQYPYQPPSNTPYGYGSSHQDPLALLLAPAKKASIFLFIMGALMAPCGLLAGLMSWMSSRADLSSLPSDQTAQIRQMEQQFAAVGLTLSGVLMFASVVLTFTGILMLIFGAAVRRGGMGTIVSSIILCCLVGLIALLQVFAGFYQAAARFYEAIAADFEGPRAETSALDAFCDKAKAG